MFSSRFSSIKSSIFLRLNSPKSELLYPNILAPWLILIPLATESEVRIEEKLPGPTFTIIEKLLSIVVLFFLKKSKILLTSISLFSILVCNFCLKKLLSIFKPIESFVPVQFIIKKFSIIFLLVSIFLVSNTSYSASQYVDDKGIITIMYHRFNENKYPSTNIRMKDFNNHIELIRKAKISFINPKDYKKSLEIDKNKKKILLTIDDAFLSFYENAWPILQKEKIPFILFVSTREVGQFNYMTWEQIREIAKEDFVHIGNHSHSHEYMVNWKPKEIKEDLKKSITIFKKEIGYNSNFFSYPFGEYSLAFKKIVKDLGFEYAFGQHSGVSDISKDLFELPRFPINEKYGESERFSFILNTLPLKYKKILPEEKYINKNNNPPNVSIEFFDEYKNLKLINCYSNEENKWRKSTIKFLSTNKIQIILDGKFTTERGRINCSLRNSDGSWRWLGMQFVIAEL